MKLDERPLGRNLHHLQRAVELVRRLRDEHYTICSETSFRGGVGSQVRHLSLLTVQGAQLGPDLADFGVAPSTPGFWKETRDRGHR